jgi:NAD(P)-dependent dehydrogenase (short-subunit alcohol dehydrogenase family)
MPAPVIIVTGVSRGIGRAIAEELQFSGAAIVGAARNVADVPATASLLPLAADVARAVAFLALPDSDYITGQLLAVDGGYLAQGLPG